ncbi:MAG TPA: hypothetical protein DDY13_02415 [Cytophagales bacterium]|jgi:hypothetical protein|nr:hypothetical protein [Cytophagales bacterium]
MNTVFNSYHTVKEPRADQDMLWVVDETDPFPNLHITVLALKPLEYIHENDHADTSVHGGIREAMKRALQLKKVFGVNSIRVLLNNQSST